MSRTGKFGRRQLLIALLWLVATAALSLAAAGDNVLPGDVTVARAIQSVDFPGVGELERAGYYIGSAQGAVVVGAAIIALLFLTRNIAEAAMLVAALILRATNTWIKELFDSPRPTPDLVHVAANATADPNTYGFPSGHTMGTVLVYGSLIYIAQQLIEPRRWRIALQALAVLIIMLTGLSRIYSGAHWPSDVLGGLLWGTSLLLLPVSGYRIWRASKLSAEPECEGASRPEDAH